VSILHSRDATACVDAFGPFRAQRASPPYTAVPYLVSTFFVSCFTCAALLRVVAAGLPPRIKCAVSNSASNVRHVEVTSPAVSPCSFHLECNRIPCQPTEARSIRRATHGRRHTVGLVKGSQSNTCPSLRRSSIKGRCANCDWV